MAKQSSSETESPWPVKDEHVASIKLENSVPCIEQASNYQLNAVLPSDFDLSDNSMSVTNDKNFWRSHSHSLSESLSDTQGTTFDALSLSDMKCESSSDDFSQLANEISVDSKEWAESNTASDNSPTSGLEYETPTTSGSPQREWKQNSLRYPPCAVCTGKSSGLHYGCYTCEACKNFFRRYLLRSGGFNCKKNNNCTIANRSRGNCSGCRLKKCLAVGMSKEKSKIGRYTHSQRTETIREVNKLEGKAYLDEIDIKVEADVDSFHESSSNSQSTHFTGSSANPIENIGDDNVQFTDVEHKLIDTLVTEMKGINHFGDKGSTPEGREEIIKDHYDRYNAKVKLIGPLKAIPKEEYFTLLKLYNIDLDGRWNLFKQEANNCAHIVERYCKFAYKIPGFQELPIKDQEILLKIGHCDFFIILLHEGYDPERQIFLEMNGVPAHVEEAADKIFSRELIELQCNLFQRWQKAKLLEDEKAILCGMALLCSDRVDLENPKAVENIHMELTSLLMKVLQKHYGKESKKRFAKFIDILTFCRHASDLYFKEYQEMSQFDMVQEVAPAFPTLCPDKF